MSVAEKVKVLVADADGKMRELIRTNLPTDGFEVHEAASAWDCITMVCKEGPEVIILDLDLPDHDGWEVLSLMKLSGTLVNVEVIVTSSDFPSYMTLSRFRVSDFVRKPFDVRLLLQRIDRAVVGQRSKATFQHGR